MLLSLLDLYEVLPLFSKQCQYLPNCTSIVFHTESSNAIDICKSKGPLQALPQGCFVKYLSPKKVGILLKK